MPGAGQCPDDEHQHADRDRNVGLKPQDHPPVRVPARRPIRVFPRHPLTIGHRATGLSGVNSRLKTESLPSLAGIQRVVVGAMTTMILCALSAAVRYGAGAAFEQHQAASAPDSSAGRPRLIALLVRQRIMSPVTYTLSAQVPTAQTASSTLDSSSA